MEQARILKVDLARGACSVESLDRGLIAAYLGGRGLGYKLLHDNLLPGTTALDPAAPLLFCAGLLAGAPVPASGRMQIVALSPATGRASGSNAGGRFSTNLAANDLVAIMIVGRAERPTSLWIENGRAELRPADHLWGRDVWQTCAELGGEDKRVQAAVIGPAGETKSALACVMFGTHSAAGRTGLGAVMGAKHLKAVVVRADNIRTSPASPEVKKLTAAWLKLLRSTDRYDKCSQEGQSGYLPWANEMGIMGARNFRELDYPAVNNFNSEEMLARRGKRKGCARCPVNCKADVKITAGRFAGMTGPRPEFETLIALGPRCGLEETEAVFHLSHRCGQLGLDTISAGACIAYAMDLFDRGLIDLDRTGGLTLNWGDDKAAETLLEQMAARQGFGAVLSDGVARAAESIGGRAVDYAYTVKGLEMTAYDPRTLPATALGYAAAGRGGDFGSFFSTPEYRWTPERAEAELGRPEAADRFSDQGKAELVRRCLIVTSILDSLGLCKVPALGIINDFSLSWEAAFTAATTDLTDLDAAGLMTIGERIVNLERMMNLGLGNTADDDRLPVYFKDNPAPSGPSQGRTVDVAAMVRDFYRVMGWNDQGRPRPETLHRLNLD